MVTVRVHNIVVREYLTTQYSINIQNILYALAKMKYDDVPDEITTPKSLWVRTFSIRKWIGAF